MNRLLLLLVLVAGCASKPLNPIVACLEGAEQQAETDAQRTQLATALEALATLPVEALQGKRFADYQGQPNQWDLPTLLRKHFVPTRPCDYQLDFWQHAASPASRALARRLATRARPKP